MAQEVVGSRHTGQVHILVADDDPAVRESLRRSLEFNGYAVTTADDGSTTLAAIEAHRPDLLLLDVNMPHVDGLEVCRRLRAAGNDVPVLMLTARVEVGDRVLGLDAGADDYLPKPFALEELLARARALLRRNRSEPESREQDESLSFADLSLDPATRMVGRGERAIQLTRTEFELLWVLMQAPRRVLTREYILDAVWGYDFPTTANSLEVYIGYLRRKTEAEGESRLIHTVRGVGYVLREDDA
jgi:two-component system response regulator MprA